MVESAKKFLRKVPIPICGLILGMVSLGNLLYSLGYATIGTIYCVLGDRKSTRLNSSHSI